MHEMTIVEALIEAVQREQQAHPEARVCAVRVQIGSLRQVVPEMLEFCYEAATRGTALEGTRLELDCVVAEARCDMCSLIFPVEDNWFECPHCHAAAGTLLHGYELVLMSIELDETRAEKEVMPA